MQGLFALSDNSMGTVTRKKVEAKIEEAWKKVRDSDMIPYRTGNLRYVAVKYERTGVNSWKIYLDHSLAPYDVFVNEKWTSPKWNGNVNENEGFWQKVCEFIIDYLHKELGGELTNDD